MVGYPKTVSGITGTGIAKDGNGVTVIPLAEPYARTFALQVSTPSGVITSWSVALEGSIDGVNWTALITHTATIGSTQWAVDKPVNFLRVNVTALTLGTAPSITVGLLAVP